ncbi:MAG: hypothetical protein K6T65_12220 [Peptococcaceae bacterium]|nr:hypothetical protein [Peptococcaceae bacterium]
MKLEIRRGTFAYTDVNIFRDIDLEVSDNEFFCDSTGNRRLLEGQAC